MSQQDKESLAYRKWAKNLRIGIKNNIVPVIEPGVDDVGKKRTAMLIDSTRMKIWEEAFTDSAMGGASYEPYESYGDRIAGKLLTKEVLTLFPGIQPEEITSLVAHYASNEIQGKIMQRFEVKRNTSRGVITSSFIDAYLLKPDPKRTGLEMTLSIYADMYEALLGAICVAGDSILNGLGDLYSSRWFNFIFTTSITIDPKYRRGNPYNIAKGLFNRFDFYHVTDTEGNMKSPGNVIFTKRDMTDTDSTRSWVKYTVRLSSSLINFLRSLDDVDFPQRYKNKLPKSNEELVSVEADVKNEARDLAAERILDFLKSEYGIDEPWISRIKTKLDLQAINADPLFKPSYEKVLNFIASNGYKNLHFKILYKHSKEGNYQGLQIVADDVDTGNSEVLFSRLYEKGNRYVVRKEVIREFAAEIERTR